MQAVPESLGNQRYVQLQDWLQSPAQRVQRILQVTAADWWPDGVVPQTRKAARRMERAHPAREHARTRHHHA